MTTPATPDLIPLIGARLVRTSEPDEGQKAQEGLIKDLTSGEPIEVKAINQSVVETDEDFRRRISGRDDQDSGDREQ